MLKIWHKNFLRLFQIFVRLSTVCLPIVFVFCVAILPNLLHVIALEKKIKKSVQKFERLCC